MPDKKLFQSDPRDFALEMVSDGLVTADHLLLCALKYMSHDDVRDMLDCNELSPRFDEDDDEPEEDEDDDLIEDEEDEDCPDSFGTLYDYQTGDAIRPATRQERDSSDAEVASGNHEGVIAVDWRTEGGWNGEDFRQCYVAL